MKKSQLDHDQLRVNATTEFALENYVRHVDYIPTDDPRYKDGKGMENRIEPPLNEIKGDCFDRQRVIEAFNQHKIEQQRCLILGVGVC